MPGQLAQVGAQAAFNRLSGVALPVVSDTAPTWKPGLWWIDSAHSYTVKRYNGSSWVADDGSRYLALLFQDPANAVQISDLFEITTAGYARQSVSFTDATAADPTEIGNSSVITFGPFSEDMSQAATYAALVDAASGSSGQLLYTWSFDVPQQVSASQSLQIAVGQLTMNLS